MKITPTQNFVVVQFQTQSGEPSLILKPDGATTRSPGDKIVVLSVGPDVPKIPELRPGSSVLIRGDSKFFEADEKNQIALIDSRAITAIVEDAPALDTTLPLPFEQEVADAPDGMAPSVATAEAQIEALRHG